MKKFCYLKSEIKFDNQIIPKNTVGIKISNNNDEFVIGLIGKRITLNIDKSKIIFFDIEKTGDEFDHKVCDRCFRYLETTFFSNNRLKKDAKITKRPSCKDCRKEKDGISISALDREKWNKKKPKTYSTFKCEICLKTTIVGITKVVLDHNHKNGKVRGYLCESCNTGIGRFDDNPELIRRAIVWLEKNL